jgi:hypothetical protein
MLNTKPNNPTKYDQGNYIPRYKDKVIKLNNFGGIYYRSSIEKKIMTWLDNKEEIIKWGAENIAIPYQLTHIENGDIYLKSHIYYPDLYYEMKTPNGIRRVLVEIKPKKEYDDVLLLQNGSFEMGNNLNLKKLKNLEYRFLTAKKNNEKWKAAIKWCDKKGYEFIIITEEHLKKI